ncbi:MAG: glycosyltransferase family 39 protein [Bryobacteraceae bacterium]
MAVCATTEGSASDSRPSIWSSSTALLIYVALATVIVHAIVGNRYGFHADELATLEDARHLAWGYPAYPPVTAFFGRISLILFGTSLVGFRFFASLAQAIAVVLAGLMARELGGSRRAQLVAAAAAIPFCIGGGALMQYVSFDYVSWVLAAYFIVRLLKSSNPRWWVAVGASIGLGMLSKYTMGFFVLSMVAGLLLSDARRYLKSKWFWIGVAFSVLVFLPNLLWQVQHNFVSLDFLRHIHARDVQNGKTRSFLPDQLEFTYLPLVVAGLYFYLFSRQGKRFRMLGWMYVVTLLLFVVAKGRGYYLFPAYPMLYAAAAVWGEGWLATMQRGRAMTIWRIAWGVLTFGAIATTAFFLPIAPVNSGWWEISDALQETYRGEIGWPELVQEVTRIRDSLAPEERAHLGILGTSYGEAGAINLFGPQYGLPRAISGINSFWQRGYGDPAPQALIVMGLSREFADEHFEACRLAGHIWNQYGVKNDESINSDIFVCGLPRQGWPQFWKGFRYFG